METQDDQRGMVEPTDKIEWFYRQIMNQSYDNQLPVSAIVENHKFAHPGWLKDQDYLEALTQAKRAEAYTNDLADRVGAPLLKATTRVDQIVSESTGRKAA